MSTLDSTGEFALAIRSERIFEVERFATLPNIARRLPRPPDLPSRSINISNGHRAWPVVSQRQLTGPVVASVSSW